MRRFLLLAVLALAGCAVGGGEADVVTTVVSSPTATATRTVNARPTSTPSPSPAPPIDGMLPAELDGVELHTFATGTDIVQRLAEALEMPVEAVEVRYASEHSARFVQIYAVRAPEIGGATLAEAWAQVAYPSLVGDVERGEETVGGRAVTVIHSPATAPRLGTFYVFAEADTLLVVQTFDPEVAAEAIQALTQE